MVNCVLLTDVALVTGAAAEPMAPPTVGGATGAIETVGSVMVSPIVTLAGVVKAIRMLAESELAAKAACAKHPAAASSAPPMMSSLFMDRASRRGRLTRGCRTGLQPRKAHQLYFSSAFRVATAVPPVALAGTPIVAPTAIVQFAPVMSKVKLPVALAPQPEAVKLLSG